MLHSMLFRLSDYFKITELVALFGGVTVLRVGNSSGDINSFNSTDNGHIDFTRWKTKKDYNTLFQRLMVVFRLKRCIVKIIYRKTFIFLTYRFLPPDTLLIRRTTIQVYYISLFAKFIIWIIKIIHFQNVIIAIRGMFFSYRYWSSNNWSLVKQNSLFGHQLDGELFVQLSNFNLSYNASAFSFLILIYEYDVTYYSNTKCQYNGYSNE